MALEAGDTGTPSAGMRPDPSTAPPPPPSPVPSIISSLLSGTPDLPGGTYGDMPTQIASADDSLPSLGSQFGSGVPQLDYPSMLAADTEMQREKIGMEGVLLRDMERKDAFNARRMEDALNAQMSTGKDLRPWDAQTEMASRKHDLWEQFGSPGFLIAMMASAFTTMPMVSALNGGAAAMNAINAGDLAAYDQAFEAWKTNTDLVLKRMDIQQRAFQDLDQLRKSDLAAWKDKMSSTLAMYDDKRKMMMLEHGFDEDLMKAIETEATLREKLASAAKGIQESNAWSMIVQGNPDWPYGFNGKLKPEYASGKKRVDPAKMQHIMQAANVALDTSTPTNAEGLGIRTLVSTPGFYDQDPDVQRQQINDMLSGIAAARATGKGTPVNREVERQWGVWDANNPFATDDEKNAAHNKIYSEFLASAQRNKMSTKEREIADRIARWDEQHKDDHDGAGPTSEERDAGHDAVMQAVAKATKVQNPAEYQKMLSNPQWLDSPEGKAWRAKQSPEAQKQYDEFVRRYSKGLLDVNPADVGWTPEAITAAAETFNETGVSPHYLGARQYGPMIMGAIQSRAMDLLKQRYPDKTDVERVEARTKQWQLYHTQQVALNRYESGTQGQTITSMNVVVQHMQVLKELAEAQDRGDWTTFNRIANWWGEEFGQAAPTNADMAAVIVGNELVKAIQRGSLGTGEERSGAEKFFARFRSADQIDGAIDVATKLLVGQLRAMKYGFMVATGQPDSEFQRMLLPETRAYFGQAEINAMKPLNRGDTGGFAPGDKKPVIELDPLK